MIEPTPIVLFKSTSGCVVINRTCPWDTTSDPSKCGAWCPMFYFRLDYKVKDDDGRYTVMLQCVQPRVEFTEIKEVQCEPQH